MSHRTRILMTVAAACLVTLLLVTASVFLPAAIPAWLGLGPGSRAAADFEGGLVEHPQPRRESMGYATKESRRDAADAEQVEHQYANYDHIVVEVHRDGSLCVLGKITPIDALGSLLGDQQQDGVKTVVAIQAESDCVYQYVGRVIRLCQDLGVPHLMVAEPVPGTAAATPASPA